MKSAPEIYEAFLIELDRYQSPDMQVIDFLHFWNTAVYDFIEGELVGFEMTNTVSDRLRMISHKREFPLNSDFCGTPVKSLLIPQEYFRLFGVKGVFKYARDFGFIHKKGDAFERSFKKMTADIDGFTADNRFYKPSSKRPYYEIIDNSIRFLYEDELKPSTELYIEKITLRYIKHPVPLALSDDFGSYNESPFPIDVNRLILKIAVILAMGTTEDQRIQLKTQL